MPNIGAMIVTWAANAVAGNFIASAGLTVTGLSTVGKVVAFAINLAVYGGLSAVASKALMPKTKPMEQALDNVLTPMPTGRIIYGNTRVGGNVIYAGVGPYYEYTGSTIDSTQGHNQIMNMVIEIAHHEVEEIEEVWIEDNNLVYQQEANSDAWRDGNTSDANGVARCNPSITDYDGGEGGGPLIAFKLYTGDQLLADNDLILSTKAALTNDWDITKIGTGVTYAYVRVLFNTSVVPSIPKVTFKVKGKRILDTRCDGIAFTYASGNAFSSVGHGMSDGDKIQVSTTGTLPTNLSASTDYYVINASDDTFELSTSKGGSAVTISGAGSGTHTTDFQDGYRNNTALVIADYITTERKDGGLGEDWARLNLTQLNAAAETCDESVTIWQDSTAQSRYFVDGYIDTGEEPQSILSQLADTMAGAVDNVGGQWFILPGEYTAPSMTLTESELISFMQVTLGKSQREMFNEVIPVLRSAKSEYQPNNVESVIYAPRQRVNNTAVDTGTDTLNATSHGYANGDRLKFVNWVSGSIDQSGLPGGISAGVWYYVVNAAANTFQISATEGGSAVDITSTATGELVAWKDVYLTNDKERISQEVSYSMVGDVDLARRLALIALNLNRNEIGMQIRCKLGTANACPYDLLFGDYIRLINAHKNFWEFLSTSYDTASLSATDGVFFSTSHGYTDGEAIVFDNNDGTGYEENRPYYIINASTNYFQVADYRGGPAVLNTSTGDPDFGEIQGKLFRVINTQFGIDDGVPFVDLTLLEGASTDFDWQNGYVQEPDTMSGITVASPLQVTAPDDLAVASGTSHLYVQKDGTVITRAKLTWTASDDAFVTEAGRTEIQFKKSADSDWLDWVSVSGSASETYLTDLEDDVDYDFRIRWRNAYGSFSSWDRVSSHTVIGKSAAPSAPTSPTITFNVGATESSRTLVYAQCSWTGISDVDFDHFEVWARDDSGDPFELQGITPDTTWDRYGPFRHSDLVGVGEPIEFAIRSVDTTGNKSAFVYAGPTTSP
jgi:hypothetical protein